MLTQWGEPLLGSVRMWHAYLLIQQTPVENHTVFNMRPRGLLALVNWKHEKNRDKDTEWSLASWQWKNRCKQIKLQLTIQM